MPQRGLAALGLVGLIAALGCSSGEPPPPNRASLGHAASEIEEGVPDPANSAVVSVIDGSDDSLCSGALITPNLVLTALHCVAEIKEPKQTGVLPYCTLTKAGPAADPSFLRVSTGSTLSSPEGRHGVAGVMVPPGDSTLCGRDLALLILDEVIAAAEAEPLALRTDEEPVPGEPYSIVGFGGLDDVPTGIGIRRRRDGLSVQCLGGACPDDPLLPEVILSEWLGQDGICGGDSGSPALDADGRVIGVSSRGTPSCNTPVYGSISAWAPWLKDSAAYAAGLAELTPPSWTAGTSVDPALSAPVGQSCSHPDECYTGICHDDGDARYCSRPCDQDHVCPGAYVCADEGVCVRAIHDVDGGCATPPGPTDRRGAGYSLVLVLLLSLARRRGSFPHG